MSCWALVALKQPASAKGRLAETLATTARSQLVAQMFADVLKALRSTRQIAGIAVVTADELAAAELVRIDDPGLGLNAALAHGAQALHARGVDELLILHADLPLASAAEIDALIDAGRAHGLAIAPDKSGLGTNALYLPLPAPFAFRFGPDSLRLHLAEAAALQRPIARIESAGLGFDIDEPQDLQHLLATAGARYDFLRAALPGA
ncbi:MAG: 2-phospho-L-lactate guanylyltransferase [Sterolibacterium sp.]|nr:2-phospho-L-lactate guanylyltransferase [Sterolibacterium sp.]